MVDLDAERRVRGVFHVGSSPLAMLPAGTMPARAATDSPSVGVVSRVPTPSHGVGTIRRLVCLVRCRAHTLHPDALPTRVTEWRFAGIDGADCPFPRIERRVAEITAGRIGRHWMPSLRR